jgi:hypothetical protein
LTTDRLFFFQHHARFAADAHAFLEEARFGGSVPPQHPIVALTFVAEARSTSASATVSFFCAFTSARNDVSALQAPA